MNKLCVVVALLGLGLLSRSAAAQVNVIMSGLDNPHGLAVGPDGGIYVAEAGRGGSGTSIIGGEGVPVQFGASGAVSRWLGGTQERVITGLPSLASQAAPTPGGRAGGLNDIAFNSTGDLFGVIGFGGNPANRAALSAASSNFGHLVRLPLGGAPVNIADVASFEASANPDAGLPDSNLFGLLVTPAGFQVADAGANAVFAVTPAGVVSTTSTFGPRPNPLPFGPPTFQAVPTTVTMGPDGALYVGQLTGFPFPPGAANVYRVDPITGVQTVEAGGFTNIIDLAFGPDGDLFVLQITSNGLAAAAGPGPGKLIRIDSDTGAQTTLLDSPLFFPGGLLVMPDETIYVSNLGVSPGGGQVLQLIPEPGSVVLIGAGFGIVCLGRRGRRGH